MDEEVKVETPVTEVKTKDPSELKLNYPRTLKVGLGFAVVMIFWTVYNFVVPLLLDQAFGFSNTIRNVIVGIASAMCMVLLPIFGKISDKSGKTKLGRKFGRRTPFIVIGTVITIIAMILVPISVQNQLKTSNDKRAEYEVFFQAESGDLALPNPEDGGTITRNQLMAKWYDEAAQGDYSHLKKVDFDKLHKDHHGKSEAEIREFFIGLYDVQIANGKLMGVIGEGKYTLRGEEISKEEYDRLNSEVAMPYSAYVSSAANDYISAAVNKEVNWGYFAFFLISLLLIILAQTVIRTPAVSLMPDVTPSPLRSPGNAMINLIGGIGGGIGFLIYTITFMFDGKLTLSSQYWIIFGTMAGALALVLGLFILFVKEKKWVKECNELCLEYGLPVYDEKEEEEEKEKQPEVKLNMMKQYGKSKMTSFLLILGAIFMWFIGYYAISNNMPIFCVKYLGTSTGIASIVSGASMVVAAIGFIPVGIMAKKIGRRWSIIFGFGLAILSYVLVACCVGVAGNAATIVFMVCYMVSGFGLIFANVNTLPMVLEVSSPEDIGKFTGIYYIATMSAQTLGPIFGGLVMDYIGGSSSLFIFSAICIAIGAVMMFLVKHGEAPDYVAKVAAKKQRKAA